MIGEAAGELERRFGGRVVADQLGRAFPADFDPGEQIGLGPRELYSALRLERCMSPKISASGMKDTLVPRRLGVGAEFFERAERRAAREALAVELLVARHLDHRVGRQRVDDADPDAVQAARGGIGLALELAARMERGHDDLERRLAGKFGVRVDRDAAAIVGDGQAIAGVERDLDAGRMARDRLVHAVVDHFGGEVMQRAFVGAADIHAGAAANRLQPLQHLDLRSVIALGGRGRGVEQIVTHGYGYRGQQSPLASAVFGGHQQRLRHSVHPIFVHVGELCPRRRCLAGD